MTPASLQHAKCLPLRGNVDHEVCSGMEGESLHILRSGRRAAEVSNRSLGALVAGYIMADPEANHHRDEEAYVESHDSLRTCAAPMMMMVMLSSIPALLRRDSIQM